MPFEIKIPGAISPEVAPKKQIFGLAALYTAAPQSCLFFPKEKNFNMYSGASSVKYPLLGVLTSTYTSRILYLLPVCDAVLYCLLALN